MEWGGCWGAGGRREKEPVGGEGRPYIIETMHSYILPM